MKASLTNYTIGFVLSIVLTLIPYYIVVNKSFEGWLLIICLMAFAAAQLLVQLQFFIHLGHDSKPRWNTIVFLFMLQVLLVVVLGSLWIMQNLNYHAMSPEDTRQQVQDEENIYR